MKVAIIPSEETIEFRNIDIPKVGSNEVLVKVKAVGICTFEQGYYYGKKKDYPFFGGHEICGVVEEVGDNVYQNLKKGDKVIVLSLTRCGECYYCRRGYDNQCENAKDDQRIEGIDGPGGFSEYFLAKGYEVYKIDDHVPFERGILAEPLACVTHSLNVADVKSGDYALVCGAGAMGIIHLLLLKLRGVKVIVSEPNHIRRQKALEFGADFAINPIDENIEELIKKITNDRGVEKAFFTAGGKNAIEGAILSLALRGVLVIYGSTNSNDLITIDPRLLHYNEIVLTGVTKHTKETIRVAAQLLSLKNLELDKLITSKFSFDKIEDALKEAKEVSSYRPVIIMK